MKPNETLLDLLLEVQALDRVKRTGYVLRGVDDPESVTEHGWHLLLLVWILGRRIEGLDLQRAMEIALIHDIGELRIGDIAMTAGRYFPSGAKATAEAAALEEIMRADGPDATGLAAEFEAATTPEARLVKACDKLQLMIKVSAYEGWGAGGLAEFWENPDNFGAYGFEEVRELFEELRERHQSRP